MSELENNTTVQSNVEQTGATAETEATETTEKTSWTKEEVEALLQKESDRRVTEALKKQEKKTQEKLRESERLARMNESEKYEYQLEQREKAIAEKERQLALAENKNEAGKILAEKGLSLTLVDFVVAENADEMNDKIKLLEKAFKASVKSEVEKRLSSTTPKKALEDEGSLSKESFAKLSIKEQQELYQSNPELYKNLIK